jgi:hypothetical protein
MKAEIKDIWIPDWLPVKYGEPGARSVPGVSERERRIDRNDLLHVREHARASR